MAKTRKELERIAKGFANHRRIQILELLDGVGELPLFAIAERLGINIKTASEHTKKMVDAGLIEKQYAGLLVRHRLTDRGKTILEFCRILE